MRDPLDNAAKFFRLLLSRRSAYPKEIQIEVTNQCNLSCAMCPHTHGGIAKTNFPIEWFERLVQSNPAPKRLVLTGWGEPLMHDRFWDLIRLGNAHWPGARIRFTTNGILLDEKSRGAIQRSMVAGVTVSVDLWPESNAWTPKWKDILHPPSPKSFRNIQHYLDDENLCRKTPLVLQALLVPDNVPDIEKLIDFASTRPVHSINVVRMQLYGGMEAVRFSWREEQRILADLIAQGKRKGVAVRSANAQSLPIRLATHYDRVCMRTDDSMYITVEGGCTPCCNLRGHNIGSIAGDDRVASAWNSDAEAKFFADQEPVCGSCDALFWKQK